MAIRRGASFSGAGPTLPSGLLDIHPNSPHRDLREYHIPPNRVPFPPAVPLIAAAVANAAQHNGSKSMEANVLTLGIRAPGVAHHPSGEKFMRMLLGAAAFACALSSAAISGAAALPVNAGAIAGSVKATDMTQVQCKVYRHYRYCS
jgi:hypothetical protein